jgi:protein-tyrosine phosphatase
MIPGSFNLRDLGGMPTAGGMKLRSRHLIRSGRLSGLRLEGVDALLASGITRIVDFRGGPEREEAPTPAEIRGCIPILELDADSGLGDPNPILKNCLVSVDASRRTMSGVYRELPDRHKESYRQLFEAVAEGHRVLFHCAAGKDRTGVATALMLEVLGVDRSLIKAEFALSEQVIEETIDLFLTQARRTLLAHVDPAVWRPMMRADGEYLDAMFAEIDARYGSVEGYLATALRLPRDVPQRLRSMLLEQPNRTGSM